MSRAQEEDNAVPPFIPGLRLGELFYREAVLPILAAHFPHLAHSAGRLDGGSEVLGFDTPLSTDHTWGPRVTLFLSEEDFQRHRGRIIGTLADDLPLEVHGYSTHFGPPDGGNGGMAATHTRPISHGVDVTTIARFFEGYLGLDPAGGIGEAEWLRLYPQRLRTVAHGGVFHDGLGGLEAARKSLGWYPRDVWLYLLANQWRRIGQEEPFMARCGDVGDELGSRVVAARLVDEVMRLCFLMERRYPPYYKWFGTAFSRLRCADALTPILHTVFDSTEWRGRERHLSAAYLCVSQMHNALGLTDPVEARVAPFFTRPYLVPHAGRFADALHAQIASPTVKSLPWNVGALWQFADSTDVLDSVERSRALMGVYEV